MWRKKLFADENHRSKVSSLAKISDDPGVLLNSEGLETARSF